MSSTAGIHSITSILWSRRVLIRTSLLLIACTSALIPSGKAQPGTVIDLPKPDKYENRTLASERTGPGRINPLRRAQQNVVTHYNFHFNAANKLAEVVDAAKRSAKYDYARLLPFEDFSLEATASQKEELDSVILKCNNGILLHDLRNDWVDDLYLLMGMAYFHRGDFDSALIAFQYINYAFQPRSRDELGNDKAIGSRFNETGNVYTISTPERRGVIPRMLAHTPARNEAFIWMLRTLMEQGRMNEAGGLIETLRRDESLPARMAPRLEECLARWFYRSAQWDSAAVHLERSLSDYSASERSRREYLTAQLYERAGMPEDAERLYASAISHTTDPVLEAYARINQVGLDIPGNDSTRIRKSLQDLDRMSRRSRYEDYRQVVHYAASRLELRRGDTAAAIRQMRNSIAYGGADSALKSRSFRELGDLSFSLRDYVAAADCYDSVKADLLDAADTQQVVLRTKVLRRIANLLTTVRTRDSLLRIASLPEAERMDYVRKLSRTLRKAQGLKEDADAPANASSGPSPLKDDTPVNLFAANEGKGEWYFYNGGLKAQGFRQFQAKWGKRPNLDNWRRMAAVEAQLNATSPADPGDPGRPAIAQSTEPEAPSGPQDVSVEGLMANLPLTDSLKDIAHTAIQSALLELAVAFREDLDMCRESVAQLTSLLDRYPKKTMQETVLYQLCTCLRRSGDMQGYGFYRRALMEGFGQSRFLTMLDDPGRVRTEQEAERRDAEARYGEVVTLMIQGRFEEAMERKRQADSGYGRKYWTSELQYVEALYLIRERRDSLALQSLKGIVERDPAAPLAKRAGELEKVLARRAEIEDHLTKLDIRRYPEDSLVLPPEEPVVRTPSAPPMDSTRSPVKPATVTDTSGMAPPAPPLPAPTEPGLPRTTFLHQPADSHAVIMVLERVDVVYRTEARIALNRFHQANLPDAGLGAQSLSLTEDLKLVQVAPFANLTSAMDYWTAVREAAARDLFPWLPAATYRFLPVSLPNLELLLRNRDINAYLAFLHTSLPDQF